MEKRKGHYPLVTVKQLIVYHVPAHRRLVYLKLTIVEDLLIVSFKEKDR